VKRLIIFAGSVIPEDPAQLFLLGGSILLLISMELRCFPVVAGYTPGSNIFLRGSYYDPLAKVMQSWLLYSIWARLPIVFAGAAGLFICFWPGAHPVRRILCFVCLPALAGLVAISGRFLYLAQHPGFPYMSILQRGPHNEAWVFSTVWSLGPAVHMSVVGIAMVLVFCSRLATGVATLPLSLARAEDAAPHHDEMWKRMQAFIWVSITCTGVIGFVASMPVRAVYLVLLRFVNYRSLPPNPPLETALEAALLGGVAAWAVGEGRWRELRQFTRLPEAKFGMLGIIFPIAINLIPNLVVYLSDRIHWAASEFGRFSPPIFAFYFHFPNPYYFWYLFAAGFEEIIWRGYLQPRFVQRFGVIRGMFLLGLAWSAFHFLGDFQKTTDDYEVLLKLTSRLGFCIAMSYVLGWLTLRSGSIWPAALAHGLHNVWAFSQAQTLDGQEPLLTRTIVWTCWGLLAFTLFRFWPPSSAKDVSKQAAEIRAEPTV
jgi:membrane protease YdiL (CAAX protease family)